MLFKFISSLALIGLVTAIPTAGGKGPTPFFYQGHDLSSLKLLEDTGSIYKDTTRRNETRPAEAILGDGGMNTVRLRLWVNPENFQSQPPNYNLGYTLDLASRFHKQGYRIYLDYHFSDTWADPQKQYTPAGWPTSLPSLASTLRKYVSSTLESFHQAGVPLSLVSIGNEIRHGMLWPLGQVNVDIEPFPALVKNFTNLATLYKSAREGIGDAVKEGLTRPSIMIRKY
jgi:arabinogalactan endo-1,4-beta-galactosidase